MLNLGHTVCSSQDMEGGSFCFCLFSLVLAGKFIYLSCLLRHSRYQSLLSKSSNKYQRSAETSVSL